MGHELSYSPLDNSLMFLLAGIAVGLHAAIEGSAPRPHSEALDATPSQAPLALTAPNVK